MTSPIDNQGVTPPHLQNLGNIGSPDSPSLRVLRLKPGSSEYSAVHYYAYKHWGRPSECEHCGKTGLTGHKIHWANISGQYLKVRSDWKRLCTSCHSVHDTRKTHCPQGHAYSGNNIYHAPGGNRIRCQECNRKAVSVAWRKKYGAGDRCANGYHRHSWNGLHYVKETGVVTHICNRCGIWGLTTKGSKRRQFINEYC